MIPPTVRVSEAAPESLLHHLTQRDAALWVDRGLDDSPEAIETLAGLIGLPWRLVLCDSTSGPLANRLSEHSRHGSAAVRSRGFLTVVAADPAELRLPPRSLPVYFLNGRDDATTREESPRVGVITAMARRANCFRRLIEAKPHAVLILTNRPEEMLYEFAQLWEEEGLRAELTLASERESARAATEAWIKAESRPQLVEVIVSALGPFGTSLTERAAQLFPEQRLVIRLSEPTGQLKFLDITDCELAEQPILDRYDILQEAHLRTLLPHELADEEFNAFFDRSKTTWAPYAAGLPWKRFPDAERAIVRELTAVRSQDGEPTRLLTIVSEAGAGGTTLSRQVAFIAASAGYPTLIARQTQFRPDLTEVSRFLLRVRQRTVDANAVSQGAADRDVEELPWLIVFDVQQWQGRETDLLGFTRALGWEGRSAVVLVVTESPVPEVLHSARNLVEDTLTHELAREDALRLGEHLNQFLRAKRRDRSATEWENFWRANTPRIGAIAGGGATFWVALEFWIKRQLDLGESIQSWLYRQFAQAQLSNGVRRTILNIAALGIERIAMPDVLVPASPSGELPFSYVLSETRRAIPALGLSYSTTSTDRYWGVAHGLLARYLITAACRDRRLMDELGLDRVTDPIELRLALLRDIATAGPMSRRALLPLAIELAVAVLKLDRDGGNYEFFQQWREVLRILEDMPDAVWNCSRTFNHHVAISRRRVATDTALFDVSDNERRQQLLYAVEDLEYAINDIPRSEDDERDLNLLNSLARAYLDLAQVEERLGTPADKIRALRDKASAAARAAHAEDPTNSYVLETIARDLLFEARTYGDRRVENTCMALGYVFQAMSLESAPMRQGRLRELIDQALAILVGADATAEIDRLCGSGNPFGFMARACAILGQQLAADVEASLAGIPAEVLDRAIAVLSDEQIKDRNWAILKLQYDLIAARHPRDFQRQLEILDELEGTQYRASAQEQLERAILLHQVGRHPEGNEAFADLRRRLSRTEALVKVPHRLRMLLDVHGRPRTCAARVVAEPMGYRAQAEVLDLKRVKVPFVAQDWGVRQKPLGEKFYCSIIFGPKGPMAKPPVAE